ncbi:hypothetical protein [Pontixanthobacter luteolus]|uniref:hypothetical protein n=1 Tax=Pontixanthobacter luteolus TaxID=295089 RepID=UPI0023038E5C|nr:hypothetical protein [Pontixanthobacter luteolus]
MRVALLSSLELLGAEDEGRRAFMRIGGRSVLQRQMELALAFGCERIACLSDSISPELMDLQSFAESRGTQFQIIRDARPLSGMVKSDDKLLVIGDGVVFDQSVAHEVLGEGRKVLTLPADRGVPLGFERLDRDRAWAGVMIAAGALVERLADMPRDIDPVSTLLRLALQSGSITAEVSAEMLADDSWALVNSSGSAAKFEKRWLAKAVKPASFAAPTSSIADRTALSVLKRHTRPQKAVRAGAAISIASLIGAAAAGWAGYPVAGLGIAAITWFSGRFAGTLSSIVSDGLEATRLNRWSAPGLSVVVDALIIMLALATVPPSKKIAAFFAVFMLLGLLRVLAAKTNDFSGPNLRDFFQDRGLLLAILCTAAAFGNITLISQAVAAILMLFALVRSLPSRITQV